MPGVAADGVGHARIQLDHIDSNAIASTAVEQISAEITTNRTTLSCPEIEASQRNLFSDQSPRLREHASPTHRRSCLSNLTVHSWSLPQSCKLVIGERHGPVQFVRALHFA